LLYGDLDGFKPINDRLGHAAGDTVLRVVARRLAEAVRKGDRVGRLGGDEFLVACADVDTAELAGLAERIGVAVRAPIMIDGDEVSVGITIGISLTVPPATASVDDIVAAADRAMYSRKRFSPAAL
jgi:diguanylate cyclase (GGDEF)-like protein